jgi:putative ABC transport system permease protein
MDDRFNTFYEGERRIGKILSTFASLAIFVGCLGLFGMAAFVSEQRRKEIGIRKVLGASVPNIIKLLSREFAMLVGVSNLIAWPAAYFIMTNWLQDYAYKAPMGLWIFVLSGVLSLGIALSTTGYQAVKAARTDPVKCIRYE